MITVNKEKIEGIVIKTSDYKDNNSTVLLLTSKGLANYIIRGTRNINSKLSSIAQPLKKVQYTVTTNKTINTVTEGYVIENYTSIRENSIRLLVSESMLETVYNFAKHIEEHDLLYDFFLKVLEKLQFTDYPLDLLNYFDIKMWYLLGISPVFSKCPICNSEVGYHFSITNGGNLCVNCKTNNSYDEYVSNLLKITFLLKVDKLNDEFLTLINEYNIKFNEIIINYYRQYLEYENLNRKLIKKLL